MSREESSDFQNADKALLVNMIAVVQGIVSKKVGHCLTEMEVTPFFPSLLRLALTLAISTTPSSPREVLLGRQVPGCKESGNLLRNPLFKRSVRLRCRVWNVRIHFAVFDSQESAERKDRSLGRTASPFSPEIALMRVLVIIESSKLIPQILVIRGDLIPRRRSLRLCHTEGARA